MQAAFFTSLKRLPLHAQRLQIGVLASDCRVESAITLVEMVIGARPCVTAPIVSADFDTQAKPNGELLELCSRQEIPCLFRDVIAVLTDPASSRVDRLRTSGDVPEQAAKSADELTPDVWVDR